MKAMYVPFWNDTKGIPKCKILFHFLLKNMPSTYLYVLTKKGKLKTQEH